MKQLKLPDVGNHLLLKIESRFSHGIVLASLGDDGYCTIDLKTSEGIACENELVCCDSVPKFLGEVRKYCDIYFMRD